MLHLCDIDQKNIETLQILKFKLLYKNKTKH